ncbi:MAG: tetratricopeptide (TPR) repeat protein [Cryomorphaceae bacterium]|jgi:tetratricopeptide (TPR) repeat protein
MIHHIRNFTLRSAALVILFSPLHFSHAQEVNVAGIPEATITALQDVLTEEAAETSATKKRRACKSIIREGNSLLKELPTAPNRFQILDIMLQSHRRLLTLDNSEKNRESLFETCAKLARAPDSYALLRLEADLILSEKKLSEKKAGVKERAQALADLVKRYRNTPGEAKSLMMASIIAPKLDAFELQQTVVKTLTERFQSDLEVIEFRKKNVKSNLLDVVFSGTYKDTTGTSLTFPIDRLGHTTLLYFWSQQTPDLIQHFANVTDLQTRYPNQFSVFSFNLDELPDAGEKVLRENNLDWKAMHLPGGKNNSAFKVFIGSDPGALLINAYGHSLISSSPINNGHLPLIPGAKNAKKDKNVNNVITGSNFPKLEESLDSERYHSQLQSLFIGDFLVANKPTNSPATLAAPQVAIQQYFSKPPHRYRISQEQALSNYTNAEKICQSTIDNHPEAADLWQVRNRRIIALLGMWNLASEPQHLETAFKEAKIVLKKNLPIAANVVSHFCIAKHNLRMGNDPVSVLESFIKNTGGDDATASAIAATALLAMDANQRDIHAKYRELFLKSGSDDPSLWPVIHFLRDRHHTYRAFMATHSRFGYTRAERHAHYRNIAALDEPADTSRIIQADLTTLEGKKMSLPQATDGKITFVAFMELPADEESEKAQNELIKQMTKMVDQHEAKGIKVIAAFLSSDKDKINALVKKNEWSCEIAILPDGFNNPLVAGLGILSADLTPNIFLLRPDASISWSVSGLNYPVQGSRMSSIIRYGIEAQINVLQMEVAKQALDDGDFKKAVQLFSSALKPEKIKGDWWATFRHYSRARAYVGLEKWEAALADMDIAFEGHKTFGMGVVHRCGLHQEMELYKADILDKLGRSTEANALRTQATKPTSPHNHSPFGIYTENRESFRLNPHSGK